MTVIQCIINQKAIVFRKGFVFMQHKNFELSRTKKILLDKKRRGEKYVTWKLSKQQEEVVDRLRLKRVPWLYEIKTKKFSNVCSLQYTILRDIHYAWKRGKKTIVTQLNRRDIEVLSEYDVQFHVLKYKIYLF